MGMSFVQGVLWQDRYFHCPHKEATQLRLQFNGV